MSRGTGETAPGVPEQCLSFSISGPWAHFRRIEGNIVKQTYRIIPRTTLAGLVAAMLGIGRDEYYHLFQPATSAVAIEPTTTLRTVNMPQNTLSTTDSSIKNHPTRGKLKIGLPDPSKPRQQHNYEVLVDPSYRVDLWIDDENRYGELRETLERGESYYVPSLGLSEHLASITYHGEFSVSASAPEGAVAVDSVIPSEVNAVISEPGLPYGIERSPAFMEASGGGRTTTGFQSYAYSTEGIQLRARDVEVAEVDDRTVMFA